MGFPKPSQRALDAQRYVRSDHSIAPNTCLVQLSQNESALRPDPSWVEAATRAAQCSASYPDPECKLLRQAIGKALQLDPDHIFCTSGLMECLHTLALTYLDPEDHAIIPEHAFAFFKQASRLAGAQVTLAKETDFCVDIDNIIEAITPSTKMVLLANPANPTGTYLNRRSICELLARLPSTVLLVVDEAYAEFVDETLYEPLFDLVETGNVVILRSFSKMYGLAGLRIGWACCSLETVEVLRRIQVPSIVSSVAQAVAVAALGNKAEVITFATKMRAIKQRFVEHISTLDCVRPVKSQTNFVLLETQSESAAVELDLFLRQHGIVLRRQMAVSLGHCLRATVGTEDQMQFLASTLVAWSTARA